MFILGGAEMGYKVLLVEDDHDIREAVMTMWSSHLPLQNRMPNLSHW